MPKRKNLNGLPYNLAQQYFSSLFYWDCGYTADWIWCATNEKDINEVEIDILNRTVTPKELEIEPITHYLYRLQETIKKVLEGNGFPNDFVVTAKLEFAVCRQDKLHRSVRCVATLSDKEGRVYQSKPYVEKSFEELRVFGPAIMRK